MKIVRINSTMKLLGTSIAVEPGIYVSRDATNQPDWEEKGKIFVREILLERGEYEDIPLGNLDDYIECALWSSTHCEGVESIPFDEIDVELADETRETMASELLDFENLCSDWEGRDVLSEYLSLEGASYEQLARDFWLTRNGHGAGFWDRGYGEIGDAMTEISKTFGSVDLYLGDDGSIYQA